MMRLARHALRVTPPVAMMRLLAAPLALAALAGLAACENRDRDRDADRAPAAAAPAAPAGALELIEAPAGADLPALVVAELTRARAARKALVVYVGASWCEPCVRFHDAAAAGRLDATFPDLRVLVFDADRDGDALAAAGYTSQMIPLFVVPGPDGRATTAFIEGGIKGDGAVDQLVPRLRRLLAAR